MKNLFTLAAVVASASLVTSASPARILGIDVSTYQGTITWSGVAGDGVKFSFARATMGTASTDGKYSANTSGAKGAGIQASAYHFAYPAEGCPSVQVNHHWASAGSRLIADGKSLYPMVD